MTTLDDFLNMPNVADEIHEITLKRLGTFKVKPMTHDQFSSYQKRAKIETKKGFELDSGKLNLMIVANQIVEPDFANADFLAKVGLNTAEEFIRMKFKAGEISEIAAQVTTISGFDIDFQDKVDEAKN